MKIAIVTGASEGLGREYVIQVVNRYPHLEHIIVIARNKEKLEQLKNISEKIIVLPIDLINDDSVSLLSNILQDLGNPIIDLLINNAGMGDMNNFDASDINVNINSVLLNNVALLKVTHCCLKNMSASSKIINVSSIAAFAPNERMAVYCATKAFVNNFSLSLRSELKPRKIKVCAVCPGPMWTPFIGKANIISDKHHKLPHCDIKSVAVNSLKAVEKNKSIYVNKAFYKLFYFLTKILPVDIATSIAKV